MKDNSDSIISSEHEGGHKLDGLGGIAAILRYKLYWLLLLYFEI